jgi:hypothetical protein
MKLAITLKFSPASGVAMPREYLVVIGIRK